MCLWLATYTLSSFAAAPPGLQPHLLAADAAAFALFLADAAFRLALCPDKCAWLRGPLNIVELTSLALFFSSVFLMLAVSDANRDG
jgi:hypothetical protein